MPRSAFLYFAITAFFAHTAYAGQELSFPHTEGKVHQLYTVTLSITVETDEKIKDARVVKVTDALSGSTAPVNVEIPQCYLISAKKTIEEISVRKFIGEDIYQRLIASGKPIEFLTTLFYNTQKPESVILEIMK